MTEALLNIVKALIMSPHTNEPTRLNVIWGNFRH